MMPPKNVEDLPRWTKSGKITTTVSLSPRARALIASAAKAESTSYSELIERLVLRHCRRIIAHAERKEAMSTS